MTRIKICGLTREIDVRDASAGGADALGLVFYSPSPRYVSAARAAQLLQSFPPFVSSVGLFVNASVDEVRLVLKQVRLDILQFHGDESPQYCAQFGIPFIKAVRVRPGLDLLQYAETYGAAKALLLDAYVDGIPGGTGASFDWSLIPPNLPLPIILSGGLGATSVGLAVQTVRPYAVDVSSGVESSKGIKDKQKMYAFIKEVFNATV
ncbi:MAG: phosphoribosylanthranilate isomerase [Betaproteobacteria bacterium]